MSFRAHYRDRLHDCWVEIQSSRPEGSRDAYELRFELDGIRFTGMNLCDFELAEEDQAEEAAGRFRLMKWGGYLGYGGEILPYTYALQRYELTVEIPVQALQRESGEMLAGTIYFAYCMQERDAKTSRSRYRLDDRKIYPDQAVCTEFRLHVDGKDFKADRPTTYFEQALLQVCEKCGGDYRLTCCFTCQYSDYSPYGCDDFGSMLCYRKHKEVYLTVNDKDGFFERLEGLDFEVEQETGVCGEYEERTRCEGYRGMVEGRYILK